MFDSSFFFHLFPIMFRYIDVTLGISLAALLLALLIAVVIAAAYYLNIPGLKQVCAAWVSLFRGTPLLAQLFWICYGLPQVIVPMQRVSVMTLIIWGVAFNASSYMSETLRGALSSVSSAQMEASLACGMTRMQGFWHIVFPQAVRAGALQQLCGHHQAVLAGLHPGRHRDHGGGQDGGLDQPEVSGILHRGHGGVLADCDLF